MIFLSNQKIQIIFTYIEYYYLNQIFVIFFALMRRG